MGIDGGDDITARADLSVRETCSQRPDFVLITTQTPLLLYMVELKKAAAAAAMSSKLAFFPSVYGYFSGGTSRTAPGERGSSWNAGIEMSYPLTDGGSRFHKASRAASEERMAQWEVERARLDIRYTLEEKWAALQSALDQGDVARRYLDAALER
jgi:outer membrane protein TolC